VQRKIREDVATQGWSWIWVFDPDRSAPPFAYTVGFAASFDHPEVVVVGLPKETSEEILKSVQIMIAGGRAYEDGDLSDDILDGFPVRYRLISRGLLVANLVQAVVFYGDRVFDALQLLWPDRDGNYPGKENAPAWLTDRQTLVF
jgi:hypothetical protein